MINSFFCLIITHDINMCTNLALGHPMSKLCIFCPFYKILYIRQFLCRPVWSDTKKIKYIKLNDEEQFLSLS